MAQEVHRIHIRREALKFSAAHMTVFPDGTKESHHGHNYSTEISLELADISLAKMISFSYFKGLIKRICDSWDEKVLIAKECPYLKIRSQTEDEIDFTLCGKHYVLPAEDTLFLSIDNITAEALAQEFCRTFLSQLDSSLLGTALLAVHVRVDESPGQGASYFWRSSSI